MRFRFWQKRETDLDTEIQTHLQMSAEDRVDRGESRDDANRSAQKEFGNVGLVKEITRDVWGWRWLEDFFQDARYGLRSFRRTPIVTAVAILSLAFGIGANSALFSVVDAVLLKTLPVKDPEALVLFEYQAGLSFRTSGMSGTSFVSDDITIQADSLFRYEVFARMRQAQTASPDGPLSDFFAFAPISDINAFAGQQAQVIDGQAVSGGYFNGLGVQPVLGRTITKDDDQRGAAPVVVLSYSFWREQYGADPGVLGQQIKLNQQPFTIIGVTPREFNGTLQVGFYPVVTIPIFCEPVLHSGKSLLGAATTPGVWWLDVMGRLKPGATREQAREFLHTTFQTAALEVMPPPRRADEPAQIHPKDYPRLRAESGSRGMLDERRMSTPTIYGLFFVVALVLLIACANIANLLLARGTMRSAEISVRLAVGAGRWRLIRQLLTESVLLASLGGATGLLFALWGKSALATMADNETRFLPAGMDLSLNWTVLIFTLGISVLTGVLFGLTPALRATRQDLASSLKQSRRTTGALSRFGKGLVVAQVALSVWLLIGAGLFLRTLHNLQNVNLGFNPENLLVFRVQPDHGGYKGERLAQFYEQLLVKLDNLPGVRAATFARVGLIARDNYFTGVLLPGDVAETAPRRSTARQMVRENYFAAMNIPFLRGRGFTAQDDARGPQVAIVNQTFAREYFPNQEVLGKRIGFRRSPRTVEIIGVVADTKYDSQRKNIVPLLYTTWRQESAAIGEMSFSLRTMGEPNSFAAQVQQVVHELDSTLPVTNVGSQAARSEATLSKERLYARLLGFFGTVALLLAGIGLAGVLAYSVAQRTNEIGIRMALGAEARGVVWLVIRDVLLWVGMGAGVGLLAAIAASRLISSLLFEVTGADPMTIVSATLLLAAVAAVAAYVPARRASTVDPMVALRYE
ncbi:MAG: ABC transporter permease [Acidobacteria bacterium]|nr:ABC transporter permease [Acidobacteriota bacterium]